MAWVECGPRQQLVFRYAIEEGYGSEPYAMQTVPFTSFADQQSGACNTWLTAESEEYFVTDRVPPKPWSSMSLAAACDEGIAVLTEQQGGPPGGVTSAGPKFQSAFKLVVVAEGTGYLGGTCGHATFEYNLSDETITLGAIDTGYFGWTYTYLAGITWKASGIRIHEAYLMGIRDDADEEGAVWSGTGVVTWDAPLNDGHCPPTCCTPGGPDEVCTHSDGGIDKYQAVDKHGKVLYVGPNRTFSDMSLDPYGDNLVRVRAHNRIGWGPWSQWSNNANRLHPG